jgi:Na+/melibiose symporter-like transporter
MAWRACRICRVNTKNRMCLHPRAESKGFKGANAPSNPPKFFLVHVYIKLNVFYFVSYLPIYLGRYLHNKFLAPLLWIVLNCVFKVFPFYFSYLCLYSSKKETLFCSLLYFVVSYILCFVWTHRTVVLIVLHTYFNFVLYVFFFVFVSGSATAQTGAQVTGRCARATSSMTVVLRPLHVLRGCNFKTFSFSVLVSFSICCF